MDSHPVKDEMNGYNNYYNIQNPQNSQNFRHTTYNQNYYNNQYQNNEYQQRKSPNSTNFRNYRSKPYNNSYNNNNNYHNNNNYNSNYQNYQNYSNNNNYNNHNHHNSSQYYNNNRSYQNNIVNNNEPSYWQENGGSADNNSWLHPCDNKKIVNNEKRQIPPTFYTKRSKINRSNVSWRDNIKSSPSPLQSSKEPPPQQQYTTKKTFGRQRFNPSSNGEDNYVSNKLIFNQPRSKGSRNNNFTTTKYDESKNDDSTPTKTPTTVDNENEKKPYRATPKTVITDDKLAKLYTIVKKTFLNISIKLNKPYPGILINDVKVRIHDDSLIDISIKDEIIVKNEPTFGELNKESTVVSIDANTSQVMLFFKLKQRGMWSCFFKNEAININSVRVFDSQETHFTTHGLGYEVTTPNLVESTSVANEGSKECKYPYEYKQDSEFVTITFKNIHPSITNKDLIVFIKDENLKIIINHEIALEGILYSTYYKDYSYFLDRNILTVKIHKSIMFQKWDKLFKKVIVGSEIFGDEEVVVLFVDQDNNKKKMVIYTSDKINSTVLAEKIINDQCKIGPKTYLRCLKDIVIPYSSILVYLCSRSDSYIEYTGPNELLTYMVGKTVYGDGVIFLYDDINNKLVSINDSYANIIFEGMDRSDSNHVVHFYSAGCQA